MDAEVTQNVTPETGAEGTSTEEKVSALLEATETGEQSVGDAPEQQAEAEPDDSEIVNLQAIAEKAGYDPETIENLMVKVKVNGKEEDVALGEALRGYQRQADYAQKTMALAEERRRFQGALEQSQARTNQTLQALDDWIAKASLVVQNPGVDLDRLRQEDVTEYLRVKDEIQERERKLNEAVQYRHQLLTQQQQQQYQRLEAYVQEQREKLPEMIPEWRDQSIAEKERNDLSSYLIGDGFTQDELSQAYDARLIRLARKAMLYDRLQAAKPAVMKKIASAPKVQKPGAARSTKDDRREQYDARMDRLRQTHDLEDAAKALEGIL